MQSVLNIPSFLTSLDLFVFFTVFAITTFVVWFSVCKNKRVGIVEHLLMGRRLTLPLFVATLVSTWYGGIFGVTKLSFEKGLYNLLTQGIFWYTSYIIFAFFLVKKVYHSKAMTMPDLIEKRFGKKSGKLAAIFNFFDVLPVNYVISLGIFLQMTIGGSLLSMMILGCMFMLFYSFFGGFKAIVISDFVQFIVMCLSVVLVVCFSYKNFGGMDFLQKSLPPSYFSFSAGESILDVLVWGFIALSTLVDPCFYQRCFAAKSEKVAKKGIILSTFIWFIFDLCTTFGGMYARACIPKAESYQAYLTYSMQLLPNGIRGFVLAGILATILSTLDSYLFIGANSLSYDLFSKKKYSIFRHRFSMVFICFISILIGVQLDTDIIKISKLFGSFSAACFLFPVLFGLMFPARISDGQFVISSVLGALALSFWPQVSVMFSMFWQRLDRFYIGLFTTMISLVVLNVFSYTFRLRISKSIE